MQRMKGLRWGSAAMAVATAAVLFTGCSDDDGDKPAVEEGIEIEGLSSSVHVKIDEDGIPRIRCATAPDCSAALGYLHARDRYIQMEVRRSFVRGRLHTIVPSAASIVIPIDQENRTAYLNREGKPIEDVAMEYVSEETRAMLDAYAVGVNVFLDEARADKSLLSAEFSNVLVDHKGILPWTAEDSLASVVALVDSLTNSSSKELQLASLVANFDPQVFSDLVLPRPVSTATTLFSNYVASNGGAPVDLEEQFNAIRPYAEVLKQASESRDRRDRALGRTGDRGSNNWAVGSAKSKSGNALLSDDPHLGHTNPATWYVVEMEAEDGSMHVAGVSFAGLPWVILGQNEHLAWGATTTYFDQADVFLETLTPDGNKVIYDGEEVELLTYDLTMTAGTTTIAGTAKIVPHHGPIIGEHDGHAVSLRWTGSDLSTDVNFLTELMKAKTVEEGRSAAELITTLGQNWVMIDTSGNFGWFPYNKLPVRSGLTPGMLPGLPLPGDGSVKWDSYMALSALPQLYNNPEGYVATANNDMTGQLWDGDPTNDSIPIFQSSVADGLRQERILDMLAATDEHTTETMLEAVGDTYMALREYVIPPLQALLEDETDPAFDEAKTLVDELAAWAGTCPTGLEGHDPEGPASSDAAERDAAKYCLLFHRLVNDLRWEIFQDELFEASLSGSAPRAELAALTGFLNEDTGRMSGTNYWDDVTTTGVIETPAEIIARSVSKTYAWVEDKLGADQENWIWGRIHRLTLMADLFPQFGMNQYNNGAYAVPGGLSTVNVAQPTQDWKEGFDISAGASMRWICEGFAEGMSCSIQVPGGQVHHKTSPFYDNFLSRWLSNTPTPMLMGSWDGTPSSEVTFVKAP